MKEKISSKTTSLIVVVFKQPETEPVCKVLDISFNWFVNICERKFLLFTVTFDYIRQEKEVFPYICF